MLHLYCCFKRKSVRWTKTFHFLAHLSNSLKGHLSTSLDARFRFVKRNGNPETAFMRTNFLLIFDIGNFSRGITNTEYKHLVL